MTHTRLAAVLAMIVLSSGSFAAESLRTIRFNRDIRPILSDKCYVCHGPGAEQRQADLRLDVEEAAKASAIVPGHPDDSELIRRIFSDDPDQQMPPADSKLVLTQKERETLRIWIRQGAGWDQHWAFAPPRRVEPPVVQLAQWPRSEIDHFILRSLEERSLAPSAEASGETLLRRVFFDLNGLPPTLEEIDAFVADDSYQAWENVVERLLSSPHFGERMASAWLDLARYSDTFGYQVDRDRHVWPWRDWVIRAFNNNMSYRDFITRQLAGDLLPNATDDDILATTFSRLHPQKVEGGSTPEEFRVEYVADRTQTFATAFLGLTMECCRCHDHKYDPISQREYYRLSAFFDNIDESGLYSFWTHSTPTPAMLLLDDDGRERVQFVNNQIAAAEQRLSAIAAGEQTAFRQWLAADQKALVANNAALLPNRLLHMDFERPPEGANAQVDGPVGKAIRFTGDDAAGTDVGKFNRNQPFTIALWLNTPNHKDRAVIWHRSLGWTDAGSRGYQLLIEDGRLHASLIHFWPGNAISIATADPLPVDEWHHVTVCYDGSSRAAGLSIFIDGKPAAAEVVRDNLYKEITLYKDITGGDDKENLALGERRRDRGFTSGQADELEVFDRELTPIEMTQLFDHTRLSEVLKTQEARLSREEVEQLFEYYLSTVNPAYREQLAVLQKARNDRSAAVDGIQEIMVMRELETPRQTWLLHRGAYDSRRDEVAPGTPAALPEFGPDLPPNRLGLAQWLTSPEQPLTARVAINHYWQLMFGHGLVRTPEDFGSQGNPPTHPELLDWLALDFMEHGWDVKRLLRQIAMSATYRQSSATSEDLVAHDPNNQWLARISSYRMPAEMLRDNALAVSGLLVDYQGGPPAKPYEVEASFKPVDRDKGEGLYRRSVYTYWKRTGPAPVMMVLDATKRDVCRVNRERTLSPLEAFVLMNGPQFVEASRALAERLLVERGTSQAALPDLFRVLTSRRPAAEEIRVIESLLKEQQAWFAEDPARAEAYLSVGDHTASQDLDAASLAALTAVANALFSYDECVTKR